MIRPIVVLTIALAGPLDAQHRAPSATIHGPVSSTTVHPQMGDALSVDDGLACVLARAYQGYGPGRNGTVYQLMYRDGVWGIETVSLPSVVTGYTTVGGLSRGVHLTEGTLLVEERTTFANPTVFRTIHVLERQGRDWAWRGLADLGFPSTDDFQILRAGQGAAVINHPYPNPYRQRYPVYTIDGLQFTPSAPDGPWNQGTLPNLIVWEKPTYIPAEGDFRAQLSYPVLTGSGGGFLLATVAVRRLRNGVWQIIDEIHVPAGFAYPWSDVEAANEDWIAVSCTAAGPTRSPPLVLLKKDGDGFRYHSVIWNPNPYVSVSSGSDGFGTQVALDGDRLVVGAFEQAHPSGTRLTGGAYIFRYDPSLDAWQLESELDHPGSTTSTAFGWQVAFLDGAVLVTDPFAVDANGDAVGAVYIYEDDFTTDRCAGTPDLLGTPATLTVSGHDNTELGGLRLEGRYMPPGASYAILASLYPGPTPLPGVVDQDLCIGFPRIPVQDIGLVDGAGRTVDGLNGGEGLLATLDPSEPLYLQLWFRRPSGSSTPAGVTNGVRVDFGN